LQWTSQEDANNSWEAWLQNKDAIAWTEKYSSVLECDGENRQSYDVAYPMASNAFGELPDSLVISLLKFIFVNTTTVLQKMMH